MIIKILIDFLHCFNDLVKDNLITVEFLTEKKSSELQKNTFSLYELHLIYENNAFEALNYFYEGKQSDFLAEYDTMKSQQLEIFEKINNMFQNCLILNFHYHFIWKS